VSDNSVIIRPASPSHRFATGPSLSPLKGGEGNDWGLCISLSAPGAGEGRGEVGDSQRLAGKG